jgi:phage-related baseplate assembly protein
MAQNFMSNKLDLSRLPVPLLILGTQYEALLAARLASLQARLNAAAAATGTDPVDVLTLETEPTVILQQEDAYRQMLDHYLLDARFKGLLPAYAQGSDLDHVASRAGVSRLVITPASGSTPAVMESDASLVMRYLAGFGAPAAGSEDGYVFHARSVYPEAVHVYCLGPAENDTPGQVDVVVTAPLGVTTPGPVRTAIARRLNDPSVRPLTDMVNVIGAAPTNYAVQMVVDVLRGPDPQAVRAQVIRNLQAITTARYRGGGEVQRSALTAAAFDAGAVSVAISQPAEDIPRDPYRAPWCTGITVTVQERLND